MIATSHPAFHFPIKLLAIGVVAFGIGFAAVTIPPAHKVIFDGPLKPMWTQVGALESKFIAPWLDPVLAPFNAVNLSRKLVVRNTEIIALKKQIRSEEFQEKQLRQKLRELQKQGTTKTQSLVTAVAPPVAAQAYVPTPMVAVTPSVDDTQTAAYWGAMEAENAAAIAQKLDPQETARIFLAMKSDQVAEIMNALPADYNVKLKEVHLSIPKPVGP